MKSFCLTLLLCTIICGPSGTYAMAADARPVVQFISTGGTIASKIDPIKGVVPALTGDDLMQSVSGAGQYARIEVKNLRVIPNNITNAWRAELTKTVIDALKRT